MLKANYHTHTKLCNHAKGMPHDYVDAAVRYGMTEIGISDHAHTPESFLSEYDYLKNSKRKPKEYYYEQAKRDILRFCQILDEVIGEHK